MGVGVGGWRRGGSEGGREVVLLWVSLGGGGKFLGGEGRVSWGKGRIGKVGCRVVVDVEGGG